MNQSIGRNVGTRTTNTVRQGYRTTRNALVSGYNQFRGASTLVQVVTLLVVIVIVIVLIMWIKNLYDLAQFKSKESPFIVTYPINAFRRGGNTRPVVRKRVPFPVDGLTFTYSMWIYVADWNYRFGEWKNIFVKGGENRRAPGLWLYPNKNSLHARINTHADPNEGCDIRNIPLQKWVHLVYVLNNRTVDLYVDGKLERSCALRGVPVLNNDPVQVAFDGGFYGQIAKMQYFTRALKPDEIGGIYSEGPYMGRRFQIFGGSDSNQGQGNNNMDMDDYDDQ